MSQDKSDTRLIAAVPAAGERPVGLRLTKTVRGRDDSLYLFMLPGTVPNPLKLSIHPTGEIQLKANDVGLITRLNKDTLIENLKSGALDDMVSRLLSPKLPREPGEGFLVPPGLIPQMQPKSDEPLKDVDFAVGEMLSGLTKVELDDLTELPLAIAWLREQGLLKPRGVLFLASATSDRPVVFINLLDRPAGGLPEKLPDGFPFPKSMQSVLDGLRQYGGLIFTMPDEPELREIAKVIGLDGLFDGLDRLSASLDQPEVESKLRSSLDGFVPAIAGPVKAISKAKPLQPLKE